MTGWKKRALHEVAEIERDSVDASAIADGTTYVGLENIESGGRFVNVRKVVNGELASNKFAFTECHVLFGKLRPYLAKIARPDFCGVCSTDILPIFPGPDLDRDYLTHFLRQPTMIELANSRAAGANLPRLSPRALAEFEIPLPPLPEQRRIAAILDQAEGLRAKRRYALAQLATLTQSIFLEMFGDLLKEPDRWPSETLGSQLEFLTSGSRGWAQYYRETGSIFLRIQNVRRDELVLEDVARVDAPHTVEARRIRVQAGDVLLSMTADLGRTAVIPEGLGAAYINQHLAILRAPKLEPRFLSAYLSCPAGQRQILGRNRQAVKAGLNFDDVRSIRLSLPPFPLQREFAERVAAVERLKAAQRESLAKLEALFASLQHRAFRGEL